MRHNFIDYFYNYSFLSVVGQNDRQEQCSKCYRCRHIINKDGCQGPPHRIHSMETKSSAFILLSSIKIDFLINQSHKYRYICKDLCIFYFLDFILGLFRWVVVYWSQSTPNCSVNKRLDQRSNIVTTRQEKLVLTLCRASLGACVAHRE